MQIFFANCTHLLTRTQDKKFEDVFLAKIANTGTLLIFSKFKSKFGLIHLQGVPKMLPTFKQ